MERKMRLLKKLEHKIECVGGIFIGALFFEMIMTICRCTAGMIITFMIMLASGYFCTALANIKGDIERWD